MKKTVTIFMSILSLAVASDAASRIDATVTIRTYNYAAVEPEQLGAAESEAAHIFQSAGISVVWVGCSTQMGGDIAPCTMPPSPGHDLMLRLVDRTPVDEQRVVALGESMLDREERSGVLMTVDLFSIRAVANRASTSIARLLGRAVAHEIGHLLLGTTAHPRLGLMRALWSHDELRGLKPAFWGFSPRESAQMRESLRAKSRVAD
jgi:hypothetical protein